MKLIFSMYLFSLIHDTGLRKGALHRTHICKNDFQISLDIYTVPVMFGGITFFFIVSIKHKLLTQERALNK